jgi:hypothetical protein
VSDLVDRAERSFSRQLVQNAYPGRGLVLGRSEDGDAWLQLYWIMGRSANSRNRVFAPTATLRTEPSMRPPSRTPPDPVRRC